MAPPVAPTNTAQAATTHPAPPVASSTDHDMLDLGHSATNTKKATRARFEAVFAILREELIGHLRAEELPVEAQEWYQRSLDYNVPGGKLNRGLSVVDSVAIIKGRALTDDEYFKAATLGWCVELLQAYFLVADDMMDQSLTRRGQPCWFHVEGVGALAINDSFMLEGAIYRLLKTHFRREPWYADLLELFHDTTYRTDIGQLIDVIIAPEDHVDLNRFSLKKHRQIVIYKTAYYSFYLPVALAMLMCRIDSPRLLSSSTPPHTHGRTSVDGAATDASEAAPTDPYELALAILVPLGEYFQIQDDFLDFAGTPAQIGKIGTDIVDNKCSWCVNTALALATPAQRRLLDENYGRKDARAEARVKALFEELRLRERYAEYEQEAYTRITSLITTIPEKAPDEEGLKREVFTTFLDKIYKRTK